MPLLSALMTMLSEDLAPAATPPALEVPIPTLFLPALPETIPFVNPPPPPTELPGSIRALAKAAFDAGDDASWKAIFRLARHTNAQAQPQIDALEAEYMARRAEQAAQAARERAERLAAASALDLWKGEVEFGATRSTGNTDALSLYSALRFEREGLRWKHLVSGRLDFQRSDGATTADRLRLGWEPSYKVNDRMFVYGLGQYERDRFLGFSSRYTLSSGIGFALLSTPRVKLSLQGGPAARYTDYVDGGSAVSPAGRASLALRWVVTPTLTFTQDAAAYLENGSTNATSTSAVETKLLGSLKARLSYDVQYEHGRLVDSEALDTTSRATLVYSF